ncbi:hypothetical protein [Glycomyces sp. NPDC048151]|uniref:hypothetical protein n=1 Tax=Glycomyces sp. NPDC048151 TaxID=3364002 RepID=UPI0037227EFF
MKPVNFFKRLGAALAAGLLALGIIAGSATAANAGGSSGDISANPNSSGDISMSAQSSGDIS